MTARTMTAADRLFANPPSVKDELRILGASGQLGYGIPAEALARGLERNPHLIGCDMGSIDPGPYYLGSGKMATSQAITRRDLTLVLKAARSKDVPLIIGTAGTAGAADHLAATLDLVRSIARSEGLNMRLAIIHADVPRELLKSMLRAGRIRTLGPIPEIDEATVDRASNIVGQMGQEAFIRALEMRPDVIIAGRACDTAIFSALPVMLGYPVGPAVHMAKIIECSSICCTPGGRDAILGTIEPGGESFTLESMNPVRAATPLSVAAHSLYEQADPLTVHEPDGVLHVGEASYEAVNERITRVRGATWQQASKLTVKIEGAEKVGERAILCAGSSDPKVIENLALIEKGVRENVAAILTGHVDEYSIQFHVYGTGATQIFSRARIQTPSEIFFLVECLARDADQAKAVAGVTKQYLLHHGFPGRLSTGGNIAFPFTPPEINAGTAYRFSFYHVMEVDDIAALFPIEIEEIKGSVPVAVA